MSGLRTRRGPGPPPSVLVFARRPQISGRSTTPALRAPRCPWLIWSLRLVLPCTFQGLWLRLVLPIERTRQTSGGATPGGLRSALTRCKIDAFGKWGKKAGARGGGAAAGRRTLFVLLRRSPPFTAAIRPPSSCALVLVFARRAGQWQPGRSGVPPRPFP